MPAAFFARRLAAEHFAADELLPAPRAIVAVRVAADLVDEAADFYAWDARLDLSLRMNGVTRSLERGVF